MVKIDQLIKQILQKPELAERIVAWLIESLEFDIRYEPRIAIKTQALADFLAEIMEDEEPPESRWMLHVDGVRALKEAERE